MNPRVLFVCLHNSGRSQMAEAFMNYVSGGRVVAESAGFEPDGVNPLAIAVMKEIGLDISENSSDSVFEFYKQGRRYNYIITVCDEGSSEKCPIFPGVINRIHISFKDPSSFEGTYEEKVKFVREVRDSIREKIEQLCDLILSDKLQENAPADWKVKK